MFQNTKKDLESVLKHKTCVQSNKYDIILALKVGFTNSGKELSEKIFGINLSVNF